MNERIRELAHQADLIIKKSNGNDFRFGAMDPNLEKFAELIVRECSSICQNVGDTLWAEQYQSNIGTARTCVAAIQEHFGVEE